MAILVGVVLLVAFARLFRGLRFYIIGISIYTETSWYAGDAYGWLGNLFGGLMATVNIVGYNMVRL